MTTDTRELVQELRNALNRAHFDMQLITLFEFDEVEAHAKGLIDATDKWLSENPKQEAPMWWQPIETAPKDGTIVLVNDTTESCTPWVAASYLNGDEWDGWVYDDAISQDANPLGPQPTHWIQLPEIPQSGEQK